MKHSRSMVKKNGAELEVLELEINENMRIFYNVGHALREIRDKKLYKSLGYIRFDDYCKERLQISRVQSKRLIISSEVMDNLKGKFTILPASEVQILPLANLPSKQQCEVWKKVIKIAPKTSSGFPKITGKLVESIVYEMTAHLLYEKRKLDIIKPSNWWSFGQPKYRKPKDFEGSIPGEIYANALYYFAPQKGIAVDAMAGSGMLKQVYQDRERWQKELDFELEVHLFDKFPQEPFATQLDIKEHDATKPLPIKADWIFIDPPYFRQSSHLYQGDLAQTQDYTTYLKVMTQVFKAMYQSLRNKGVFCVYITAYSNINENAEIHDIPFDLMQLGIKHQFKLIHRVYVSRGEQQRMNAGHINIKAKRNRKMISDACELLVFRKVRK